MSRGVIYVMTTVVPGLVKIGKTGCQNFESRMYGLERNGYFNVVGLKRHFAIEVDDYDAKEELLDEIFSKSRVPGSELFALDVNLVVQLLSSLDGTKVYPKDESKEDAFDQATEQRAASSDWSCITDGTYRMDPHVKGMHGGQRHNGRLGRQLRGEGWQRLPHGPLRQVETGGEEDRVDRERGAPARRDVQGALHRGMGGAGQVEQRLEGLEDRGRALPRLVQEV